MSAVSALGALVTKTLSIVIGGIARIERPRFVVLTALKWYVKFYSVKLDEAERELFQYRSLVDLFCRDLKPGLRPIGEGVVSPVDGAVTQFGPIVEGCLIQAKGRNFLVEQLLGDNELGATFTGGYFITLYLAPGDYHQIHSPVDATVPAIRHIEGALWPVNSWSTKTIKHLFVENERVVVRLDIGGKLVGAVLVGATNVGSIGLSFDSLRTNTRPWRYRISKEYSYSRPPKLTKGSKLGKFEMGSSVILLFPPEGFYPGEHCKLGPIKMGQSLGELASGS